MNDACTAPALQSWPQLPQLATSAWRFTHCTPHSAAPGPHGDVVEVVLDVDVLVVEVSVVLVIVVDDSVVLVVDEVLVDELDFVVTIVVLVLELDVVVTTVLLVVEVDVLVLGGSVVVVGAATSDPGRSIPFVPMRTSAREIAGDSPRPAASGRDPARHSGGPRTPFPMRRG